MTLANPFTCDTRVYNEAQSLLKAGHNVTVLAWDQQKKNPEGEQKKDIKIVRVFNTTFMDLIPYGIFKLRFWWQEGYKKALELHEREDFDALHCHNLDTLPIGVKLRKKIGLPLIYDAHEIWGYMVEKDLPWWRYYLWKERHLLTNVDHMIVTNPAREEFYNSIAQCDITIIDNYKHIISSKYIKPPNHGKKRLSVLYIGGFIKKRFLLQLIDVVKGLQNVTLNIGGRGKLYHQIERESALSDNTNFLGTVPPEKVIPLTVENDVVFCMIAPHDKNDVTASTNKQYEAMVAGRPIITANGTYSGILTEENQVGVSISFSKDALKRSLIKLRDNPALREVLGKNALNVAVHKYNWEKQEKKLVDIYLKLKG